MAATTDNWFETWFDTNYYHDFIPASETKKKRVCLLPLWLCISDSASRRARVGFGLWQRQAQSGNCRKQGLEVVGIDLSKNSIEEAKIYESEEMVFDIHDMRKSLTKFGKFDAIFNIFTSFGYFNSREDDVKSLKECVESVISGGDSLFKTI